MPSSEKIRSKALPLAILCGIVSVLLFFAAMGTGARMARSSRMSPMNRGGVITRDYPGPGKSHKGYRDGRRAQIPSDQNNQNPQGGPTNQGPGPGRRGQMPGAPQQVPVPSPTPAAPANP